MKNRVFSVSIMTMVTVLIALIFICLQKADASEKINLKFYHAMRGNREKVLNELIKKFNRENPDIEITAVQSVSSDPQRGNDYHALYNEILKKTALKDPPDIAQVYENWTIQLISINAIIPLEDYIGEEINDLIPVFRSANTFDGKLWTLPFNKSIYTLFYNKDMFAKANLQPPKTWKDFKETALKLTEKDGDTYKCYGVALRPSVDLFGHYLYSNGGTFIQDNEAVFNNEVGVEDLKYWVDLVHTDRSALISFSDRNEFEDGRCAMLFDTTSRIQQFKNNLKFNWGVVKIPQGSIQKAQFAGTNIAVFSHLDLNKKEAAVKFVKFLSGKQATLFWAVNTGYLPVRVSTLKSPEYKKLLKSDERYNVGVESLNFAVVQPKTASWEMIRGIIDDAMYDAISLRSTPAEVLNRAVNMSNQFLKELANLE